MNKVVLLIEADQWLGDLYQDILQEAGFTVVRVVSAQSALDVVESQKLDVIVLDLMLGDVSGVQLLHELRSYAEYRIIPIIIQSAIDPARCGLDESSWREYGVVEYLYKVTSRPKHLLRAVTTVTGGL